MGNFEQVFKALGNKKRLEILKLLLRGNNKARNVVDIAEAIMLSYKATSKHLHKLRQANLLENQQVRSNMLYRVSQELDEIGRIILEKIQRS